MISTTARSTQSTPLKEAIECFLRAYDLKSRYSDTYLPAYWERIMGPSIAKHTKRCQVKDKKLYLELDSAPLRQELYLAKTKLVEVLNTEAGERIIEDVVFL